MVLAVIPHENTPFTKRVMRKDIIICFFLGGLIMSAYVALAFSLKMGVMQ